MRLRDLLNQFRVDTKDAVAPYLFSTLDAIGWLGEAEEEACIRSRLLFDDSTTDICEIFVLNGVREYAIDPRITEIVTAYLTDADGVNHDVAIVLRKWLDIQNPDWRTETDRLPAALMHLSKRIAFDVEPNADCTLNIEVYRKPLVSIATRHAVTLQDTGDTVTHVAHGRSNNEAVMFGEVNLTTGIVAETVYYIREVATDTYKVSTVPGGSALTLTTNGTATAIYLDAEPEIEEAHHRHLVNWAMHRAYSSPDADTMDKGASMERFALFEMHFGAHPGADMRHRTNALVPRSRPGWF